jgi:hypothetical protein
MRRQYDVFEKFPDGSTLWRACVAGRYEAERKTQELTEHSANDLVLLDSRQPYKAPISIGQNNSRRLIKSNKAGE